MGDDKINYFGSSYGTRIGSLYAQLFTDRVGRMVLDGAVSLETEPDVTQLQGFERALDHFATWCATEKCRLGASRDEVLVDDQVFPSINSISTRLGSKAVER